MTGFSSDIVQQINNGAVGVLPTDTIYGVVANALDQATVERIYELKLRSPTKPFIILISSLDQLEDLSIQINDAMRTALQTCWPGPVSVVLPCQNAAMTYLHRGQNSLAIRLPADDNLQDLIEQTGPIVATSANFSNQPYISDLSIIKNRLPGLDFYIEGSTGLAPSQLAKLHQDGRMELIER